MKVFLCSKQDFLYNIYHSQKDLLLLSNFINVHKDSVHCFRQLNLYQIIFDTVIIKSNLVYILNKHRKSIVMIKTEIYRVSHESLRTKKS